MYFCGVGFFTARCVFVRTNGKNNLAQNFEFWELKILATRIFLYIIEMENKKKRFEIRLTEKQDKMLREQAAKAGLEVSEYVRRKIFIGEIGVMDSLQFLKQHGQYTHEIAKIGTNINQLAHYANILLNNNKYSKEVVDEMTIQLRRLTSIEVKIEDIVAKILKI